MKLRLVVAVCIFLGSYLPLSLILLAQDYDYTFVGHPACIPWLASACSIPFKNWALSFPIFVLCLLSFAVTLFILASLRPKQSIVIRSSQHVPADLMNYTLPYVVSFMSLDYQEAGKLVGLLIFLGWMFFITYRSGQIILNPVLIAFGWKLFDISYNFPASEAEQNGRALARGDVMPGERHRTFAFQEIYIVKLGEEEPV